MDSQVEISVLKAYLATLATASPFKDSRLQATLSWDGILPASIKVKNRFHSSMFSRCLVFVSYFLPSLRLRWALRSLKMWIQDGCHPVKVPFLDAQILGPFVGSRAWTSLSACHKSIISYWRKGKPMATNTVPNHSLFTNLWQMSGQFIMWCHWCPTMTLPSPAQRFSSLRGHNQSASRLGTIFTGFG